MGNRGSLDEPDEEFSDEDARRLINPERAKLSKSQKKLKKKSRSKTDVYSKSAHQPDSTWYRTAASLDEGSTKLILNLLFYRNEIRTRPEPGFYIEEILTWYGNHEKIETHAYTILQWLFPTKNRSSTNEYSQPLQDHEIVAIRRDDDLMRRAQKAFNLMLEFYGMQTASSEDGKMNIQRAPNWSEGCQRLNSNRGNVMRITRMLSCMGEMGFNQYQCIWLRFLLTEIVTNKTIQICNHYTVDCWINALASDEDKVHMVEFNAQLRDMTEPQHSPVTMLNDVDVDPDPETETERMQVDDIGPESYHDIENINLHDVSDTRCIFMMDCSDSTHWLCNMPNVLFYLNRTKCLPEPGFYLEELKSEESDIHLMYRMHKHIQWLFPTHNQSERNSDAIPLTEVEAEVFANSTELKDRFIEVYRLLLSCYGLDMVPKTGEILITEAWAEMSYELNKLTPLSRIITRILTSLGVIGFPQFQMPLLYFLLTEAIVNGSLANLDRENVNYWIEVIANDEERQMILEAWRTLKIEQQREVPSDWNVPELRVEGNRSVNRETQNTVQVPKTFKNETYLGVEDNSLEKRKTQNAVVLPKTYGNSLRKEIESEISDTSTNQIGGNKNVVDEDSNWDLSNSEEDCNTQSTSVASKQIEWELHNFSRNISQSEKSQYLTRNLSVESDKNDRIHSAAGDINVKNYESDSSMSHSTTTRTLITNQKENKSGWFTRIQNLLCGVRKSKSCSGEDLYPYVPKPVKLNANVEFYRNKKKSSVFWGHTLQEMLQWKGDYHRLEMNHQYIQWLFPIPEGSGVNSSAQALQPEEAEVFQNDPILQRRVLRAFQMMLDFYGMELLSEDSVQIQRTENWVERYQHLNRSMHNHLRITRIIKSLGYLGLQKYQSPWVNFILHEVFEEQVLPRLGGRQCLFWIEAIADETERHHTYENYIVLKDNK